MLRRRRKTPKDRLVAPAAAPASRRRPRPGVQVPGRLLVKEPPLAVEPKPKREPARARDRQQDVVLVTGFDAFCGETLNPSWEICTRLPAGIAGMRVETCRVPCEFARAVDVVTEAIERVRPALVILLGQAGGRARLGVERIAINVDDARVEDNAGAKPVDEPIAAGGPAAYVSTLPIKAMVGAMQAAGVPAEVSNSAGTYVCNHLMYGVLHYLARKEPGSDPEPSKGENLGLTPRKGENLGLTPRAGFIHVPYAEAQVLDKPAIAAMSIDTMVKGVEAAIAAAHRHHRDLKLGGGTLD